MAVQQPVGRLHTLESQHHSRRVVVLGRTAAKVRRGVNTRVALANLAVDGAEALGRGRDGVKDGTQRVPVVVLAFKELLGRGEQEVRIPETLHDERHLLVTRDACTAEPVTKRCHVTRICLGGCACVPPGEVVAGLAHEPGGDRGPHLLPGRYGHEATFAHLIPARPTRPCTAGR